MSENPHPTYMNIHIQICEHSQASHVGMREDRAICAQTLSMCSCPTDWPNDNAGNTCEFSRLNISQSICHEMKHLNRKRKFEILDYC